MTVVSLRPLRQGLEPWVGASDLGDIESEMNRLFDTFFATCRA
jgi:hypothetical protein